MKMSSQWVDLDLELKLEVDLCLTMSKKCYALSFVSTLLFSPPKFHGVVE